MDNYEWMRYFQDGFPALWAFFIVWSLAIVFSLVCLGVGLWQAFRSQEKDVHLNGIWNPALKVGMFLLLSAAIVYTIVLYTLII